MSPIASVASASALSSASPAVALDPDSVGKTTSAVSQHLLGTGGFLVCIVALFSVAGYFYYGRRGANGVPKSTTWGSLGGLVSSMRKRGCTTNPTVAATDWPADVELGFEDRVDMVYGRYFHPRSWNMVESHPATPFAPAIYVEDEAAASEPKALGVNSFLHMDDEDDPDHGTEDARKEPDRVKEVPPYDTRSATNLNFSSQVIGSSVRGGTFLCVPGQTDEDSSEESSLPDVEPDFDCSAYDGISTSDSDGEFDLTCSPYDGIAMSPPTSSSSTRRYGVADMGDLAERLKDRIGLELVPTISGLLDLSELLATEPASSNGALEEDGPPDDATNSDRDVYCRDDSLGSLSSDTESVGSPYEDLSELLATGPTSFSGTAHPGDSAVMSDCSSDADSIGSSQEDLSDLLATVATSFSDTVEEPDPGDDVIMDCDVRVHDVRDSLGDRSSYTDSVGSPYERLFDLSELLATEQTSFSDIMEEPDPGEDATMLDCDICHGDSRASLRGRSGEIDSGGSHDEGQDLMRELLEALRDPNLDFTPRSLSEDSESQYSDEDKDEDEVAEQPSVPRVDVKPNLLESTSTSGADPDLSDDGPAYPITPPLTRTAPLAVNNKVRVSSPATPRKNRQVMVMSPMSSDSPPLLPTKAYVRSHRDSRSKYGPRVPLVRFPHF